MDTPPTGPGRTLQRIKEERGWVWPDFDRNTQISSNTARSLIEGKRVASLALMDHIASELGVDPNEWPEYRLAKARERLDERVVGLEQALKNLGEQ